MSRAKRERAATHALPLVERQDGSYGVGRYVWQALCRRAGQPNPRLISFVVHTPTAKRSSARTTAQQVLDSRGLQGTHFIATTLTYVEREKHEMDHILSVNDQMTHILEEIANDDVAAGARRLVWEQRAEWGKDEMNDNTWTLFRSSDDVPLLSVWINPVVERDWDYSVEDAFDREVER